MSAFVPQDFQALAIFAAVVAALVLRAWIVNQATPSKRSIALAWVLVLAQVTTTHFLFVDEASGFRMVALIIGTLWSMKAVVIAQRRYGGMKALSLSSWSWFCFVWVGMEPRVFATKKHRGDNQISVKNQLNLVVLAIIVLWAARLLFDSQPLLAAILLMIGLSLILHFTLLRLLAFYLRAKGFKAREPFDRPILSQNLGEFWGKRWNRPFIELGSIAVYRPLERKFGRGSALFGMFLVSGFLHEMAISLPVQTGYGGPMLYFILHGGLVLIEEILAKKGHAISGIFGRLWTVVWLVAPLPILFHQTFVQEVLLPLAAMMSPGN